MPGNILDTGESATNKIEKQNETKLHPLMGLTF